MKNTLHDALLQSKMVTPDEPALNALRRQIRFQTPIAWKHGRPPALPVSTPAPVPRTGVVEEGGGISTVGEVLAVAGTALGAFHGYKRNNSVGWAVAWGVLGGLFPIIVIPVAFAQGFSKRAK